MTKSALQGMVLFGALISGSMHGVLAAETISAAETAEFPTITLNDHTRISGIVSSRDIRFPATISVIDSRGLRRDVKTDDSGRFSADASQMSAPLRLSAIEYGGENCLDSNRLRAVCLGALLPAPHSGKENTANINPLTDRMLSDVAAALGYLGPQQFLNATEIPGISRSAWNTAHQAFHAGFDTALKQVGIRQTAQFAPLTYAASQHAVVWKILTVINHARNYHNNTGQAGHTVLTDIAFRPIVGLNAQGDYEPLDYASASQQLTALKQSDIRIFIVGDSTAATYEKARYPRMGWGQVFAQQFRTNGNVYVVNGARSGRSSRDFYYEGWFRQMEPFMRPGDYMFIHMGHNDQNCNSNKAERGAADVANLCTYPNNAAGQQQYPAGKPDMSFQQSLERYIRYAREHQMHPVLLTPTARVKNAEGKTGTPVVHSHYTRQNQSNGYAFVGDYTQTIHDTASANKVPLLDVETATIALANQDNGSRWQQYWLAVDPDIYPYYRNQQGSISQPDTTHFQQKGALAVAAIVADAIRNTPELKPLATKLATKN
ncbi:pectin acetylesterase PaeY [Musicola paradisiaca]|uniref:Lipolytic protein G-D-S-L family n=1 Tax=Musicola paradisiaca (strain Ech703) TaxID=579405 RepID=C6CAP4_MUSP7|nr:pectin acetylesterase PaeY [Musicola paradisiaca]ACS86542.1 lipolytic protein G-D-S-L family [Musicola paradisiaca Ech703]